jgi:AraC family transcriptional regulator
MTKSPALSSISWRAIRTRRCAQMRSQPNDTAMGGLESASDWYARMPPPIVSGRLAGATLRCFGGTSPTMEQPALDENVVSIHLGGPKRINRWQGQTHQTWDVPLHSITLMPAFRANRWQTEGVVAYAHLTIGAEFLARLAHQEFDREPGELLLLDRVGIVDPLLAEVMLALGREIMGPGLRRLYRDSLLATLGITALKRYATLLRNKGFSRAWRDNVSGGLASWQLRRVVEHMAANALRDVGLDELVQITGLSRSQFFRAFHRSTGTTPAHYMQQLRMRHAATLLEQGRTISDVAGIVGYGNSSHFAAVFRRHNGANPSEWRRVRRASNMSDGGDLFISAA